MNSGGTIIANPAGECTEIFWSDTIPTILGQFSIRSGVGKHFSNQWGAWSTFFFVQPLATFQYIYHCLITVVSPLRPFTFWISSFVSSFKQAFRVFSSLSRKVVNVVQSGLYLRVRWRLIMIPKDVLSGAQNAVQAAKGAFSDLQRTVPAVTTTLHSSRFWFFCDDSDLIPQVYSEIDV